VTVKKILTFLPYYTPSVKAGGPVKSLNNLVSVFNEELEFWVVTRDRDIGDVKPYKNIEINTWSKVGDAFVFYASPDQLSFFKLGRIIRGLTYDLLYLNSFFSFAFSIKLLTLRKFRLLPHVPILLAPRGEFSPGALQLKKIKKALFILVSKLTKLHGTLLWHASTKLEKKEIISSLDIHSDSVLIAKNLPTFQAKDNKLIIHNSSQDGSNLRIVFLSRISPKKNLEFALNCLLSIKSSVIFDIYGPKEDLDYWMVCEGLIKTLPENIVVNYRGMVLPDDVNFTFSQYDLFFFPTHGENYGHVIAESLAVGTSVLLSDQTPWRNLQADSLGWDLPLVDETGFIKVIDAISCMSVDERANMREKTILAANQRIFNSGDIEANRHLFLYAINEFGKRMVLK